MHIFKNHITVGHTIADNAIDITSYTLTSKTKGKRVYIQSGIHGGEITYWIQHRLFNFLRDNLKSGEVVFVPFASPASWEQRSYFYTHGKFDIYDGRDFNYNFPGKENGSLHQRTAFQLFNLAKGSDLVLDLHTARNSIPYCIYTQASYAPLIKEMGLKYNFFDEEETPGSIDHALDPLGIANFTVECGSHDEYDAEKIDTVFAGILRLLARFDMIDKKFATPVEKSFFFSNHKKIVAQESGFIRYDVKPGDAFKSGCTLFTLFRTSELGTDKTEIATEDGIAYKFAPTHIYRVGDDTLHYIPLSELKPL